MVEGGCGNDNDAYGAYADDWRRAELAEPNFDMNEHVAKAWEWWRSLGSPQCVVAPMVDASELPWRVLSFGSFFLKQIFWKNFETSEILEHKNFNQTY